MKRDESMSQLAHTLPEDKAPPWWKISKHGSTVVWPPEAVATDRLRRMLRMAAKVEDRVMVTRIEQILATRASSHEKVGKARALGPEMLTVLSGLVGICNTDTDLAAKLEDLGLLGTMRGLVTECQQAGYAKRGTKARRYAESKAESDRAKIDASRPKGLANAKEDEPGD